RSVLSPSLSLFVLCLLRPVASPLFPYTTLFRSLILGRRISEIGGEQSQHVVVGAEAFFLIGARQRVGIERRHVGEQRIAPADQGDRKSTRLNSSHVKISYAVFCLKKKNHTRCEA